MTKRTANRIKISGNNLQLDHKPIFIRSGEVSYFRIPRQEWRDRLRKAKEANLNCISTYVPWFWHEPEELAFDFTGRTHPERDLRGYLDTVAETGLLIFIRPGPFINSELIYGGYPRWLFEDHPEVNSLRSDGQVACWVGRGGPVPSLLHPKYLELVDRWYEQVIPIITEYHIDKGGPVILTQPDNEFNMGFTYSLLESGYDVDVVGDGRTPGRWQRWLSERYGPLDRLQARYGLRVDDLARIDAPRTTPADARERLLALDWLRFKQWYIFEYAAYLAKKMNALGLTVPWTLNEPINMVWDAGDHASASKTLAPYKGNCFTTGHLYLTGGEQDILGVPISLYRIELMKAGNFAGPKFASEIGAGWADLSRNRASYNWEILSYLALGHGLNGYNIYMFCGGYNPPHTNVYGRDYDWEAPVGAEGNLNESYLIEQRVAGFVKGWEQEILPTEKAVDARVAIFSELPLVGRFCEPSKVLKAADGAYGRALVEQTAYSEVYDNIKSLLTVLTALNINVELVSLTDPNRKPGAEAGPLIVPNPGALNREGLDYVVSHLKSHGKILFYPTIPSKTVEGEKWHVLLDELKIGENDISVLPLPMMKPGSSRWTLDLANRKEVAVDGRVRVFKVPSGAEIFATCNDSPCIFRQRAFGGEVIVSGILPTYLTSDSQRMFQDLFLELFGLNRHVRSLDGRLHAVLRESAYSRGKLITVANVLGRQSRTQIELCTAAGEKFVFPRKSAIEIRPKEIFALWADVDLYGLTLRYCTSEIVPQDERRREFTIRGSVGTTGEIAFDRRVKIQVDGEAIELVEEEGLWIGNYSHQRPTGKLIIMD